MLGEPKVVVLGVGNLLLGDEGVGVHLIRELDQEELDYVNLKLIDGGTSPEISALVEGADKVIIIDAVKGGGEPGTIYRLDIGEIAMDSPMRLSLHQMNILDSLRMLDLIGKRPRSVVVIGIEPKNLDLGLDLSPEIEAKMAELKKLVIREIKEKSDLRWY
jgi:hydrogenase maturation protease